MPSESTGESYANTLFSQLESDGLDEYAHDNLVALVTDGASNMVNQLRKLF